MTQIICHVFSSFTAPVLTLSDEGQLSSDRPLTTRTSDTKFFCLVIPTPAQLLYTTSSFQIPCCRVVSFDTLIDFGLRNNRFNLRHIYNLRRLCRYVKTENGEVYLSKNA